MSSSTGAVSAPPLSASPTINQIIQRMRSATRAQVVGHMRPDGDCLGSLLGVHHILNYFKVEHALAAGDFTIGGYDLIPGYDLLEPVPRAGFNPDLTIFVDCADIKRAYKDWRPSGPTISIDHHAGNTLFAEINWVDPDCAAVGEMLFILARQAGVPLNPDFANALFLAIMTDTGAFRFSNVRPRHYEIAAELMRAGASATLTSRAAYESRTRESVEMMGMIFSSLNYECGGQLVWGELREDAIKRLGGPGQLPENLASELRTIRGVEAALLFLDLGKGLMRVNLRSHGHVDVSKVAARFGGGGHPPAAGITIENADYEKKRSEVIKLACEMLKEGQDARGTKKEES